MVSSVRIRHNLIKIINIFPNFKAFLLRCRFKLYIWNYKRIQNESGLLQESSIIFFNAMKIKYAAIEAHDKLKDQGKVLSGDWDLNVEEFEKLQIFRAFREHFIDNVPWVETEYYQRVLREIQSGAIKWSCGNQKQLEQRFRGLDALFDDIRVHGYKSQQDIPEKENTIEQLYDDIGFSIGRCGELVFLDGGHRLCVAKLLELTNIPGRVVARHKEWQEFREEIFAYAELNEGCVYAPLLHPDLVNVPHTHSHDRFEIIKQSLPLSSGSLLDIGTHWGYFCHRFEEEGFDCYAVESDSVNLYFLEKLKQAENKSFRIINQSIFDYKEKQNFDVVLALYIFHHFLKTESDYNRLVEFLSHLNMKVLIFGAHNMGEEQMKGSYKNYTHLEFVEFIIENSCLSHSKLLSKTEDDRFLYMLT